MIHRLHRLHRSIRIICVIGGLVFTSCRSQSETPTTNSPASETIVSTTPPFQTKEPDRYRATRTVTIVSSKGETVVTKTLIARDGESRRHDVETAGTQMIYLDVPQGKYVLLADDNVYADLSNESVADAAPDSEDSETSPNRLLHTEDNSTTSYQKLGVEVMDGRSANKYRVVVNNSNAGNVSVSETLMWVDEVLNMPIKSETTSADGTRVTMQLSEIALDVDKSLFQIPENYERVTFNELRKRLNKTD